MDKGEQQKKWEKDRENIPPETIIISKKGDMPFVESTALDNYTKRRSETGVK